VVFSFDVFDTLITRRTATPQGIFAIMQGMLQDNRQIHSFVKDNFYELRVGAEQVARNTYCRGGIEDVDLEQIYNILVLEHQISAEESVFLQKLERQTEIENVYGIKENISRVKKLLADRERVLLISDMYLDADTIRKMLIKADPIFEQIPLYVSSEGERKNKYSGNLFRVVKEKEGIQYEEWKHFGDNEHSDFQIPQKLGIACELYHRNDLVEIERLYLKNRENNVEKQLMIGCAKLAKSAGEMTSYAYLLGCSVGGVLLYPYIKWLLEDSVRRGIKRLYFIARDGYVLKKMAEELVEREGLGITVKYIYGSRKAWRIPDCGDLERGVLDIYSRSFQDRINDVSDLADFLQVSEEKLRKYVPYRLCDPQKRWSISKVKEILVFLLRRPDFSRLLKEIYLQKKELLTAYLQQEVDVTDGHFAFVDLAGSGYTQECLARVMREFYAGTIKNYFYRMDCAKESECEYFVFYPMFVPYFTILEMMCRAPHEQTIGYERAESGEVVPVFARVDGDAIRNYGVSDFIQGAVQFVKVYGEISVKYPFLSPGLEHIGWYLDYIYNTPDEMVLNYFGDIPNMLTGREKSSVSFAPKLTDQEIKKIYWYRDDEQAECYYKGSDLPYSLKRCTRRQRRKIAGYIKYHDTCFGKACRILHKLFCSETGKKEISFCDYIADNIAIYGAGKLGQWLYRQITGSEKVLGTRYHSNVVLWMDQNYQEYQKEGLPVSSPLEAAGKNYEQLIIAVAKKEAADSIKDMLCKQGVEENKILWIKELI